MSERYDAVVIGAGPGGSTAARELAQRGQRVLLLDRAAFPRDKPCGGGVLISATRHLPFSLDPVTERVVTDFRVTYRRGGEFVHRYGAPLALMTQRGELDRFLAERAVDAGATFRDGLAVAGLDVDPRGATLRLAGGDTVTAPVVIGADGANGVTRRALGLPRLRRAVALEANSAGVPERWAGAVGLDLGTMPGGYGWVFPKGDHCNVGVGGWPGTGPTLRDEIARYARTVGVDPATLYADRGHTLPLRDADSTLSTGRVALVGDAAGLIDPLSGEGIGNAIHSGVLAAGVAARLLAGEVADLRGYGAAVLREIEPDLAVSRQLHALFHQRPWPYAQLLQRSDRFWQAFCRIVRGESSYAAFKGRLGPARRMVDLAAWQAERGLAKRGAWG